MDIKFLLFLPGIVLLFACSSPEQKGKEINDSISIDSLKVTGNNHTPATSLPAWAKELGLTEPENMKLLPGMSHQTSVYENSEKFNSVTLVYTGNYDTAMVQAGNIARSAELPLSKKYKALKKQAVRAGRGDKVKGIAYMNYDLSTRDIDFLIYVLVDEKGMLTLSATDMKQMNQQLDRHSGIENRER